MKNTISKLERYLADKYPAVATAQASPLCWRRPYIVDTSWTHVQGLTARRLQDILTPPAIKDLERVLNDEQQALEEDARKEVIAKGHVIATVAEYLEGKCST